MLYDMLSVGIVTFMLVYFLKELPGPFDIFFKIQNAIVVVDDEGNPTTFLGKLYDCWWCLSTWISLIVTILAVFITQNTSVSVTWFMYWVFVWLGAVAIANLINSFITR